MDLNLLVALEFLIREKNVTRAAARLGVTQSAMSHTLNRLRAHFEDPLLVRKGGERVRAPARREAGGRSGSDTDRGRIDREPPVEVRSEDRRASIHDPRERLR